MKKLVQSSLSNNIEIPILTFLWRWKVSTTSAVYLRFKPVVNWTEYTAYGRMKKLKAKGFVDFKYSDNCSFKVWTLSRKGFKAISKRLPLLREEGYLSENIEHDIYVMAAHTGDWLPHKAISDVKTLTEQELRRIAPEALPKDVPNASDHRPDGYWLFGEGNQRKLVALEVELNRKSTEDYVEVGAFYNENSSISSVLWIVQSQALANKISNAASQNLVRYRDIHNFILLSDFIENGWSSVVFSGKYRLIKMRDFLTKHISLQTNYKPATNLKHVSVQVILDSRVIRYESSPCKNLKKTEFGN